MRRAWGLHSRFKASVVIKTLLQMHQQGRPINISTLRQQQAKAFPEGSRLKARAGGLRLAHAGQGFQHEGWQLQAQVDTAQTGKA